MADKVALAAVQKIPALVEVTTSSVISGVNNFSETITALFDGKLSELEEFRNSEVWHLPEIKTLRQNLIETSSRAYTFIDRIDDAAWLFRSRDRIERIKSATRHADFDELNDFFEEVKRILADAQRKYLQFKQHCKKVRKHADDAAIKCSQKANQAKKKKKRTQIGGSATAVGGFAVAGVALSGVAASIILGIFTAGIATPIVLGVTGATAAVVGVTVGVTSTAVTVYAAEQYEASVRIFQQSSSTFFEVGDAALRLLNAVSDEKGLMERTGRIVDDVKRCWQNRRVRQSFLNAIEIMFEKGAQMYNQTAPCRGQVQKEKERVMEQMV